MRRRLLPLSAFSLAIAVPVMAQGAASASTLLDGFKDHSRPLLVFAGPADERIPQQYRELASNASGLHDRQVVLILATTTPVPAKPQPPVGTLCPTVSQQAALRARFHVAPGAFAVILVGKDGGEKFRSSAPVTFATITQVIDAMPMRQQEMRTP